MGILNKFKPISISLSPNVQKDDVNLALKLIFQPWNWKKGSRINPVRGQGASGVPQENQTSNGVKALEDEFKKYLGVKYAFSFNSGRSSLFAILKALNLPEKSDVKPRSETAVSTTRVLLQAFTCNAVPNPILWAGLNPLYVDCDDDFNINIKDLDRLIRTNKPMSKILIVQHTFGLPANMDEILKIAQENNIIIIEDCAHALGAEFQGKKVGTFGKAAFFSFSRDKVISSVYGGMAVTNDDQIGKKLEALQKEFGYPSYCWIFQQILHPVLLHYIILPMYNFLDLGKIFLIFSQRLHILSKAVSWQEKRGLRPDYFPKALPNALAQMALLQFNKLDAFYEHRKNLAEFYYNNLKNTLFELPSMDEHQSFLRFTVKHPKAHEIIYESWHKENILLGDWYTSQIAPDDTKLPEMKYVMGMCSNAERLAKITLNLPTHINISMQDAERIINFLKKWR